MAADLVQYQAAASERDALRSLMTTGRYPFYDIALLAEDALLEARQVVVTAQMKTLEPFKPHRGCCCLMCIAEGR